MKPCAFSCLARMKPLVSNGLLLSTFPRLWTTGVAPMKQSSAGATPAAASWPLTSAGPTLADAPPSSSRSLAAAATAPSPHHPRRPTAPSDRLLWGGLLRDPCCSAARRAPGVRARCTSGSVPFSLLDGQQDTLSTASIIREFSSISVLPAAEPTSTSTTQLLLSAGLFVMPHPDKVEKGGEDAYFIACSKRAIGVADGVGSWADIGVNSGLYSHQLMEFSKDEAKCALLGVLQDTSLCPQTIFEAAHKKTDARGSSTACIVVVNGSTLHACNLGDSGFMVLRDGAVAMCSAQQQHGFNFPFQVGCVDS